MYVVETRGRSNYVPPHHRGSGRTQFDGLRASMIESRWKRAGVVAPTDYRWRQPLGFRAASDRVFKPGVEVLFFFHFEGYPDEATVREAFAVWERQMQRWVFAAEGGRVRRWSFEVPPETPTQILGQLETLGGETPAELEEGMQRAARAATAEHRKGTFVFDGIEYRDTDLTEVGEEPPPAQEPAPADEPVEVTGRPFANIGKWLIPLGIGAVAAVGIYATSQTKWGKKQTRKIKRAFK